MVGQLEEACQFPMSLPESNLLEAWQEFCRERLPVVEQLPRLAPALVSAEAFDEFLANGVSGDGEDSVSLESLSASEWLPFVLFVVEYSHHWNTFFSPIDYPAYFEEAKRRDWSDDWKSSIPSFAEVDLKHPFLAVHVWSKSNQKDRLMDHYLVKSIVPEFDGQIVFRGLCIDNDSVDGEAFRHMYQDLGLPEKPDMICYRAGQQVMTISGGRSPEWIVKGLRRWLEASD